MRKKFLAIGVIAVLLLAVTSVSAITFGVPDDGEHPYVGTLIFRQNGVGWYSCSGTLISPTVMLTAGHCVEEASNVNDITYVRFDEDALKGRANYGSTLAWLEAEWILADSVIPHPQYDDFAAFPQTYDVGLVILSEPVVLSEYGTLPPEGFLESLVHGPAKNRRFTTVGYGMQGYINPFYSDIWARYRGEVTLIELNSTWAGGHSAKFTNNPGGGNGHGGSCYGDSGGPVFYADTNMVTAVVSWGNTPCIGVDFQFRVDTASALDFLHQYVP